MNNKYFAAVKDIAEEFSSTISNCTALTDEEITALINAINEHVLPLLNFEKPKVLVYGIYNAGKSTLVNAICGQEIAETGNRPITSRVAGYDAGKYILIDSPGIDAPIEHEKIADKEIDSCHIILFVVSSKGGFEQLKNYEKMWEIIKRGVPFIIVINERAESYDSEEQRAAALNSIKRKIIKNLIEVSGVKDIESRYDVIVVDAFNAFKGIKEGKKGLVKYSRLSDLTDTIEAKLESDGAIETLLAPLSALEQKINEAEKFLTAKTAGTEYATKREILQQNISQFDLSFHEQMRTSVELHETEIQQGFLGNAKVNMQELYDTICMEVEDLYKKKSLPLIEYIRKNFSALGISIDSSGCVTLSAPSDENALALRYDAQEEALDTSAEEQGSIFEYVSVSDIGKSATEGAAAGALLGSTVPVLGTIIGAAIGGALGGIIEFGRELFEGAAMRSEREYQRRLREVEAFNERETKRAEEENRRRQDARVAASSQVNAIIRELRTAYDEIIDTNFNGAMQLIDKAIARISQSNAQIQDTLSKLGDLRTQIQTLRRTMQ